LNVAEQAATPLMRQYAAIKREHPKALLFFRLGDFYELFFDDAVVAARELEITLTARNKEKGVAVPMCGVPYHAAESYISKLIRKGYRVAVCEQVEDPRLAKKLVRREVTRVVTPGTAADALSAEENNFLAAVVATGSGAGFAALDLSTGEFRATQFEGEDALRRVGEELGQLRPREVIYGSSAPLFDRQAEAGGGRREWAETPLEDWVFSADHAIPLLENHFGVLSLEGFGLAGKPAAASAAGAILYYLRSTQKGTLEHVDRVGFYERQNSLVLDAVTVRNLELVEPLASAGDRAFTLFRVLDETLTPMGKRLLRAWLLRPSIERGEIELRQDAVAAGIEGSVARAELRRALAGILDLERLLSRVTLETAGPRDLLALQASLDRLPQAKAALPRLKAKLWQELDSQLAELAELRGRIRQTMVDEPPLSLSDGGVIREGIDAELDELRGLSRNSRQYLANLEQRERERTGIASLKVRFNHVFGYYLEISRANLHLAPADYDRKQTLVNAERFTTPELKEYEAKILDAEEKMMVLERHIFAELRAAVAAEARPIRQTALALAQVDVLASFAEKAALAGYTRPRLEDSGVFEVMGGRHPVIEQQELAGGERFVPNDLYLETRNPETRNSETRNSETRKPKTPATRTQNRETPEPETRYSVLSSQSSLPASCNRGQETGDPAESDARDAGDRPGPGAQNILLITGPNMGGKSTYLRQAALIAIMAQMGSFVPARAARLGIVDRIFTRIGASDNLARGRSTFMVEMTETAAILHGAGERSLVLLDEVGRGTSTFDGLAIAWAVVEYLHRHCRAKTLFATHYFELTELAEQLAGVRNFHVAVKETPSGIAFLRQVMPGAADRSYGIEVAKLAGLPAEVIARARAVLASHEAAGQAARPGGGPGPVAQLTIFTPLSQPVLERLRETDLNAVTPLEALNLLAELKAQVG
jgi:DNA mismatch repair protein MutS